MRGKVRETDGGIDVALFIEHWTAEFVEVESAAALPAHRLRDAALLPIHNFLEAWNTMRNRVFAHLDTDVSAAHLVCDSGGCAGAKKTVKHEIILNGGNLDNALYQLFRLGRDGNISFQTAPEFPASPLGYVQPLRMTNRSGVLFPALLLSGNV